MMHARARHRHGFTLVELSVVLVIIGLLVGGVMVGQSMVRASELKSILRDVDQFTAAANTFKMKYSYLPGDFPNATLIWGKDNTNCSSATGIVTTPGTCNGNGDGMVPQGWNGGSNADYPEMFRFWQQLNLAGFLPGAYSGVAGPLGITHFLGGTNSPVSRYRNGVYGLWHADPLNGSTTLLFNGDYGNFLILGYGTGGHPWGSLFSARDMAQLDTKQDDGKPGLGKIRANTNVSYEGTTGCSSAASANALTAVYLTTDTVSCTLFFAQVFQ